jgi:hypothetical protein
MDNTRKRLHFGLLVYSLVEPIILLDTRTVLANAFNMKLLL